MSDTTLKKRTILQTIISKNNHFTKEPRWIESKIMSLIGNQLGLDITYEPFRFDITNYDENNLMIVVDITYSEAM
jgi:hypothetical protein